MRDDEMKVRGERVCMMIWNENLRPSTAGGEARQTDASSFREKEDN